MNKTIKIIFAGGGTGGHIYPNYSVLKQLEKENIGYDIKSLFIIGNRIAEKEIVKKLKLNYVIFPDTILTINIFKFILLCIISFIKSIKTIKSVNPDYIFTTGGYISFPFIVAGRLLNKRIYLIEPNTIPGKTNKLLAAFMTGILIGFNNLYEYFPKQKCIYTGVPVREITGNPFYKKKDYKKKILIYGGSTGSRAINESILKSEIYIQYPEYMFLHVFGIKEYELNRNHILNIKSKNYVCVPYIDNLIKEYQDTDFIISRAGANTVAEIIKYCIPAIFIPYPYSPDNHQLSNAKFITDKQGSIVLEQKDMNPETLEKAIKDMNNQYDIYIQNLQKIKNEYPEFNFKKFLREI